MKPSHAIHRLSISNRPATRRVMLAAVALLSGIFFCLAVLPVRAGATLSRFTVTTFDGEAVVYVLWTTQTEFNVAGFNISRSLQAAGPYAYINPQFIPSQSDGLTPTDYDFIDTHAVTGTVYFYKLEAVNTDLTIDSFGPISIIAGAGPQVYVPIVLRNR